MKKEQERQKLAREERRKLVGRGSGHGEEECHVEGEKKTAAAGHQKEINK